jgi:hypothetical protein
MIDLQLPTPLLDPSLWQAVVPETFWIREGADEPSLVAVLRDTRVDGSEMVSRMPLAPAEQAEWRKLGAVSFRVDPRLKVPTLLEWSREVFPRAHSAAGEVNWLREMREYETQLGEGTPSLDRLRFWPAFLRSRKLSFADTASVEWARVQALFSPQNDSRGTGSLALMNPTLQVATEDDSGIGGASKMLALWRVDGFFFEREMSWQHAAVIDELRETPRVPRSQLVAELSSRTFSLSEQTPFETIVTQMIQDGLILLRS